MSNEIVKAGALPAELAHLAGAGTDQFADVRVAPPSVKLIQKSSPEVDDGATPGTFLIGQFGIELGEGFTASVLGLQVRHSLWKPRNDREAKQWRVYGLDPDAPDVKAAPDKMPLWSRKPSELSPQERVVSIWDNVKGAPPAGEAYHFAIAIEHECDASHEGYLLPVRCVLGKTSAKHGAQLARTLRMAVGKSGAIFIPRVEFAAVNVKNPNGSHFEWRATLTTPQADIGKLKTLAAAFQQLHSLGDTAYQAESDAE